jgi:hypothetical protein
MGCEDGKSTELLDACYLLNAGFFIVLPLNPNDGGNIFLQYITLLSPDYTYLCPIEVNWFTIWGSGVFLTITGTS